MPGVPLSINLEPKKPIPRKTLILWGVTLFFLCSIGFILIEKSSPKFSKIISIQATDDDFVGREEVLKIINKHLMPDQKQLSPPLAILWGEGGIGKTEAAIAYANNQAKRFPIIYLIDCGSDEIYLSSYLHLASQLQLSIDPNATIEKIREAVHDYLESTSKSWLLIFDNVESSILLPKRGKGKIIATTRNKDLFQRGFCMQMPYFTDLEAKTLLRKILKDKETHLWKKFINASGHLPLVLNQMAHYIEGSFQMSIEDYLQILGKRKASPFEGIKPARRYNKNLLLSLEWGLTNLQKQHPQAAEWLVLSSYLQPDRIPHLWIEKWLLQEKKIDPE